LAGIAGLIGAGGVGAMDTVGGIELPAVPLAVLAAARAESAAVRHATVEEAPPEASAVLETGPHTVRVTPGVNVIVPVALGHLNRIVTPFEAPQVRTVSAATTRVEGPAVYVATTSEEPVGLYLTDGEEAEPAVSLTLWPKRIPPREVRLVLAGAQGTGTRRSAARWEAAQPYVETLTQGFRALALSRLPAGYGLRPAGRHQRVGCAQPGLVVTPGQVLEGHGLWLVTALARNDADAVLELDERLCTAELGMEVLAVAAWPRVRLWPGESTELYLALRPADRASESRARPSLLGAGAQP
jgi:conjugal transfer pilus assembly protein TraK